MKIDVHFVPSHDCSKLNHSYPNCTTRGVILLAHDSPTGKPDILYNTGDEFIAYIAQAKLRQPLSVALCGKSPDFPNGGSPCDGGRVAREYLAAIDSFIKSLAEIQRKSNNSLDFILDGSLVPMSDQFPCLKDRWMPWNATWQGDPKGAFLSDNTTDSDNRFQVFNVPILGVPALSFGPYVALDYGKFHKQLKYPYLVWEPSDQSVIQGVSALYAHGPPHLPEGLRFAINISPERFQVFNAAYTGTSWNQRLPSTTNLTSPHAYVVSEGHIALFFFNETANAVQLQELQYDKWYGHISSNIGNGGPVVSVPLKNLQSMSRISSNSFLACDATGACFWIGMTSPTTWNAKQLSSSSSSHYTFAGVYAQGNVTIISRSSQCGLQIGSVCVSASADVQTAAAELINPVELAVVYSSNFKLYSLFYNIQSKKQVGQTVNIGVGTSPSVSYANGFLAVSASDSMCWNSEYMNKEVVRFCSAPPTSTSGVLNYFLGPVSKWKSNTQILSSCTSDIFSATFDQGLQSAISLYVNQNATLRVLEVHLGADGNSQDPTCGLAVPYEGLVLDSWPVATGHWVPS